MQRCSNQLKQAKTHVTETIARLMEIADKLTAIIKEQYPNETIVRFVLPKT